MSDFSKQPVRKHIFHSLTRSLCPECRKVIDAQVLIRDNAVYLRKRCVEHGWFEALVSSDPQWYLNSLKYNKPGAIPFTFATEVKQGCPSDCGLCSEHQQHTCIGLIEITSRCNLACPICFANSGPGYDLTAGQVSQILDRLVKTEGQLEVLQISGGEPTIHPGLLDILAEVKKYNIRYIMLNTNGVRLARDPDFVQQLIAYEPTIYLQFDGLKVSTHESLRGRDLRDIKEKAIQNLDEAGLNAILVATVARGINDDEIGEILDYGLRHRNVLGVCFQPVTFSGRNSIQRDALTRLTVPDIIHQLEKQTQGMFKTSDFCPVPCPHPDCSATSYAYLEDGKVTPIPRILNIDDYLDFITNCTTVNLSSELQATLEALWSMSAVMGSEKTTGALACAACGVGSPSMLNLKSLREHFFMIQIHAFMDEYNFDLKRLMKCCVHQLLADGRAVPFCAYNNLGYRQKTRSELEKANGR